MLFGALRKWGYLRTLQTLILGPGNRNQRIFKETDPRFLKNLQLKETRKAFLFLNFPSLSSKSSKVKCARLIIEDWIKYAQ